LIAFNSSHRSAQLGTSLAIFSRRPLKRRCHSANCSLIPPQPRCRPSSSRSYFDFTRAAPDSEAVQAALNVLEAQAQFEGVELLVFLRVGEHEDRYYLDLCDRDWRVVEIGPDGWRVITDSPIRFRRTAGMLPLPQPEPGGSIEELRPFLNVAAKSDGQDDPRFVLAVAWLLAALRPRGPYPILGPWPPWCCQDVLCPRAADAGGS
jgi:hypothetical protein